MNEEFDKWFESEYSHLESSKYTDIVPHIKYGFLQAWRASRASLSISAYDFEWFSPHDSGEQAVWITEVIRTLRKAGITVPEELNAYGIRIKGKTE